MKIKMLQTHADPTGVHMAGKTYEVPEELGKALVNVRAAISLEVSVKEPPPQATELTQIDGISEKVAEGLAEFGIVTLENLAGCSVEDLEEAVKAAGVGQGARKKETWAEQAKALLEQDAE